MKNSPPVLNQELNFEHAPYANEAAPVDAKLEEKNADSWRNYPATYSLLGVNILVFLLMLRYGPMLEAVKQHLWGAVFTVQFDGDTLVRFGGCDSVLVLTGQWWRLLTACFVHGTVLHIALNMWCLWNLGLFGERLLGRYGLLAVYGLTGIAGNLLSLSWSVFTRTDTLVVGASGAVFGIAGILIVLLSNHGLAKDGVRWEDIRGLRAQVILFAGLNLLIGAAPNFVPMFSASTMQMLHMSQANMPRVDNTAHVGGCVMGMLLGGALFARMMSGKRLYRARQRVAFSAAALLLVLVGYAISRFV